MSNIQTNNNPSNATVNTNPNIGHLSGEHQSNKSQSNQKPSNLLPQFIDLSKWEESGFTWSGTLVPTSFTRLEDILVDAHKDEPIKVSCELYKLSNVTWLTMSFDGEIWVTCQRCLQPLAIDISHDADLALLYDESQQSLLDEDDEFLLLDEVTVNSNNKTQDTANHSANHSANNGKSSKKIDDYLVQAQISKTERKLLPIAKLLEDELLLDVPLSPKHNDCEMILDHIGEIEEEEEEESPFAALASLKGKL